MGAQPPVPGRPSGVGTAVATLVATVVGGWGRARPVTPVVLPVSFAAALTARYTADPAMIAAAPQLFQSEAGDAPVLPYVIYSLKAGTTIRTTSTTLVKSVPVVFDCYAASIEAADAIAQQVSTTFNGVPFEWAGGFAIPLVPLDRNQASARRTIGSNRVYRGTISFTARCHQPR